ncbi:hypothetical protein VTL71DRAFT_3060 [Oculimacula yallundae]|uniref:Zn(2)-C6 fungal-type domain-containing protein n=1 Tax=Oculimacula yallundae TaxID=86028 RepID=A0ABR4C650_9HELO
MMASPVQGTAAAPVKKAPRSSLLRSCERCRRRKIRCDDYFPCAACTRLGLQCKIGDDRKAERTQSYLEERVKRLESLLAQQEKRDGTMVGSRPMSSSGSLNGSGASQNLRLQIPTSPAVSPAPEDALSNLGQEFHDHQSGYASSFCSSPVDMANSPSADFASWSANESLNFSDQASFFDHPRRARSFPITPNTNNHMDFGTEFPNMELDMNLLIPTIEVTSYDAGMHDVDFNLPDLSIGSCSGPPSPSLTAVSYSFGNDDYLSEVDFDLASRRSSMAYSEHSLQGSDSLKPATPRTLNFTHSRPRSRSDVLPHPTQYLDGSSSVCSPDTQFHQLFARSAQISGQIIPGADEVGYFQTFLDRVHIYLPVFSPQKVPSLATAINIASEQYSNLERFKMLLILAIGSQFKTNIGECISTIPELYFRMAQKLYPANAWQQNPSLSVIQAHLLLAIYALFSTYSPLPNGSTTGSQNNAKPNIWMLNALITASAIDLNLHDSPDIDDGEYNPFLSIYVLDKVIGILLSKPNLLRGLNIDLGSMRWVQGAEEYNRMRADEQANENIGTGWRYVLEWYRNNGRDFIL